MNTLTTELMDCQTVRGFAAKRILVKRGNEIIDIAESRDIKALQDWLSVHYPSAQFPLECK